MAVWCCTAGSTISRRRISASAQVIGKLYYGSLDADGAKKVAREFAADILQQFGAKSLAGSKILFRFRSHRPQGNLVDGL